MTGEIDYNFLTPLIQAIGILLVAGLLLPMTRATPGRFLRYWSYGWACLSVGPLSAFASFHVPDHRVGFLIGYCLSVYLFGFFLWAGCRDAASGRALARADYAVLAPLVAFAVLGPVLIGDLNLLCALRAVSGGVLFLCALASTRRLRPGPGAPATGLWLMRASLAGLVLLFGHYAALYWYVVLASPELVLTHLALSSLYDALLETALAFGMVVLTADRMRSELEGKNRQLAAAAAELTHAARTDAMTGLLNRRAFDEFLTGSTPPPPGSLAVIDLNNLKPLNDYHGHQAGDIALKLVARALRLHFRVTDPLFRIGGDEFVVVMVGCGADDLTARMARIDDGLTGQRLPGLDEPIDLVLAWGAAGYDSADALPAAFRRADEAMYACKRLRKAGRCAVLASA